VNQNAVNAAMFMILCFVGVAALSVTMQAYFMAVLQVLVYGGAIMVLFLFIIMLLGMEGGDTIKPSVLTVIASVVALALMLLGGISLFVSFKAGSVDLESFGMISKHANYLIYSTESSHLGYGLFTKYMLPVQIAGFLLLIAMIGVIYISRKQTIKAVAPVKSNESSTI
jgi:NADH-quinone oxidoreductase subunit J